MNYRLSYVFFLLILLSLMLPSVLFGNRPFVAATDTTETPAVPDLFMVETKASYEIYAQPTTASERLIAAADSFSPYVVGVNADFSWVYLYFFTPPGLQAGWIRSTRLNLDEATLTSLPIIDPQNPPALPVLAYHENAAPVSLREPILEATANATAIEEVIFYLDTCTPETLQEGDTISFHVPVTYRPRDLNISISGVGVTFPFFWTATSGEKHLIVRLFDGSKLAYTWECDFVVQPRSGAVVPTPLPVTEVANSNNLMTVLTKASFEIYAEPTTTSERLVAAADSFSPYIAGVNTDLGWAYIYFFTVEGLRGGWIRSTRLNIEENVLASLPIIDPQNPPLLPVLDYNEQAVPVYLREPIIQATTDASSVREIYVVVSDDYVDGGFPCIALDGSTIREGDIVYFGFPLFALTREEADNVRWSITIDNNPLGADRISYLVEENVGEAGGEWSLPFRIWTYGAWTAEGGSHRMRGQSIGTGSGVRQKNCTLEVEPRPWMASS